VRGRKKREGFSRSKFFPFASPPRAPRRAKKKKRGHGIFQLGRKNPLSLTCTSPAPCHAPGAATAVGQCPEPEPGAGGAIVEGFVSAAIAKKEETMKNERELQQRLAFF
jgi:hypothetical protein